MEAPGTTAVERLDSWKEIASYLGRGVRTVQRWEREEGLPVHRLQHEKRGTVYAYRRELDEWWRGRGAALTAAESPENGAPQDPFRYFPRKPFVVAAVAVIVVLIGAVAWLQQRRVPQPLTLQRLTTTASRLTQATLSPDGRLIAYVSDGGHESTPPQIWIQQIGSPAAIQITHEAVPCVSPSFSPDGTRVLFTRRDGRRHNVYEIAALGGEPRLLVADAAAARYSPDGRWLAYLGVGRGNRLHIASADARDVRDVTGSLLVADRPPIWAPDSARLLVVARRTRATEPDWWVVPATGGAPIETGLMHVLRNKNFDAGWLSLSPVWTKEDEIVFSGRTADGWSIWRQRLGPSTWAPDGDPDRLTTGTAVEWWPSVAGDKLAYVSSHVDRNIWMLSADTNAGTVTGTLRRVTRGTGATTYPSLSADGRLLAFSSERTGNSDIYLKDLTSGREVVVAGGPERQQYAALSDDGQRVAFGVVTSEADVKRPAYVANVADGHVRKLCEDCNGRPAGWMPDGRHLLLERFGGPRISVAVMDTETGAQVDLLMGERESVSKPRLSPDGRWLAFEVRRPTLDPATFVAPLHGLDPIPRREWIAIDHDGMLPSWSPDGRLLYFVAGTGSPEHTIRARRFDPAAGQPVRESFDVFPLEGMIVTQFLNRGATLITARDRIYITLASFTGDVWMTALTDGAP